MALRFVSFVEFGGEPLATDPRFLSSPRFGRDTQCVINSLLVGLSPAGFSQVNGTAVFAG